MTPEASKSAYLSPLCIRLTLDERASLKEYGSLEVRLRVTLSYFIEPNPADRVPSKKFSYASHRLKFDLRRPLETIETLRQRVNSQDRPPRPPDGTGFEPVDTSNEWQLGVKARNRGSIISDVWVGTATNLSEQNAIVIMPEGGWWKYRKHLNHGNQRTRYALIVTLEADNQEIDIYTKITNEIGTPVDITTR